MVPIGPKVVEFGEPHLRRHAEGRRKDRTLLHQSLMPLSRHRFEDHFVHAAERHEESSRGPSVEA
jgi:hypothetical protein